MTRLGYDVLTASDGESSLQSVVNDRPDLVLLDVNMPGIDGIEVCRRLKTDPKTRLSAEDLGHRRCNGAMSGKSIPVLDAACRLLSCCAIPL
jgi:CheY-like chemotaxis protein